MASYKRSGQFRPILLSLCILIILFSTPGISKPKLGPIQVPKSLIYPATTQSTLDKPLIRPKPLDVSDFTATNGGDFTVLEMTLGSLIVIAAFLIGGIIGFFLYKSYCCYCFYPRMVNGQVAYPMRFFPI